MKVFLRAVYKFAGVIMLLIGLVVIIGAWTEYLRSWPDVSFLSFLTTTWTWSAILTVVGGFIFAIGIIFVRV